MSRCTRVLGTCMLVATLGGLALPGAAQAQTPPDLLIAVSVNDGTGTDDVVRVVSTGLRSIDLDEGSLAPDTEYWHGDGLDRLASGIVTMTAAPIDYSAVEPDLDELTAAFVSPRSVAMEDWQKGFVAPSANTNLFRLNCTAPESDCGSDASLELYLQIEEQDGQLVNVVWYRVEAPQNGLAFDTRTLEATLERVTIDNFPPAEGTWFSYAQQ